MASVSFFFIIGICLREFIVSGWDEIGRFINPESVKKSLEGIIMKRTILIGSLFACFLMLMIPNISAIESLTVSNSGPDYDEEELIQAILQRIEELKVSNPTPKPCWNSDDPDGPYEGGLDDPSDWINLFLSLVNTIILGKFLNKYKPRDFLREDSLTVSLYILNCSTLTLNGLLYLADAFDIFDYEENGS